MNYAQAIESFVVNLKSIYDEDEANSLAFYAIEEVCKVNRSQVILNKTKVISAGEEHALLAVLNRLKTGEPIQYIIGEAEFYGLKFKVNESVLIPRPETEELVEWILFELKAKELKVESEKLKAHWESGIQILDIGTGSGCIPITLKAKIPGSSVSGLDISADALKVASANAKLNNVDIKFLEADILNFDQYPEINNSYSVIVSNPPYITDSEKADMHVNVLNYEPHKALFVPDTDPLLFYKRIADFAKLNLIPGGMLFFEINEHMGNATVNMLVDKGFKAVELKKDLRGRDRMLKAAR